MYAGAAHADTGEYRECVRLWNYALSLKIMKVVIRRRVPRRLLGPLRNSAGVDPNPNQKS